MLRTTPRTPNPYREIYKQYAETQMTLEEILEAFKDYDIYGALDNWDIHIIDSTNHSYLFFESIGYEDDDCVPTIYETSAVFLGSTLEDIVGIYLDHQIQVTKLNQRSDSKC